jgi:hypothetical protein
MKMALNSIQMLSQSYAGCNSLKVDVGPTRLFIQIRWLDPEFHSHDHSACAEALKDPFFIGDKVHGTGSAAALLHRPNNLQLDWSCAYKAKAGILQNETVWANAAKMPPEAWCEMYVKPWHPELATVEMLSATVEMLSLKSFLRP